MSMWTRQEVLNAHASNNGTPPDAVLAPDEIAELKAKMAYELAAAAFGLAVFAVSLSLYLYLTRSGN